MIYICINELIIIASDHGLSPGTRPAIIWTNFRILLSWPLGTNLSEILIAIYTFSFKKIHMKMLSGKWRPSCLSLNMLNDVVLPVAVWDHDFCSRHLRSSDTSFCKQKVFFLAPSWVYTDLDDDSEPKRSKAAVQTVEWNYREIITSLAANGLTIQVL